MSFRIKDIFNRKRKRDEKSHDQSDAPLFKAVVSGNVTRVRQLLEQGADPNICNSRHISVLHIAAYWGESQIVDLLVAHKANVNADNGGKGWTPLHSAAVAGGLVNREEVIASLVKAGADFQRSDKNGYTPQDYMMLWDQDPVAVRAQLAAMKECPPARRCLPRKPQRVQAPRHT